jgi:hypothetical protein
MVEESKPDPSRRPQYEVPMLEQLRPENSLLSDLLQAVGWLFAGLSGLCTLAFRIKVGPFDETMAPMAMLFGGVPFVVSVVMILIGRLLRR